MSSALRRSVVLLQKLLSGKRVTYSLLTEEADVSRRTAMRWIAEARDIFRDQLREETGANGEKEFWLASNHDWIQRLKGQLPTSEELAAVDVALRLLQKNTARPDHDRLTALRGKLHRALEEFRAASRAETDTEALTNALGTTSRPGPHIPAPPEVDRALREALLKKRKVSFSYRNQAGRGSERKVAPVGLLYGGQTRLVGVPDGKDTRNQFRLDRMSEVRILDEPHDLAENTLHRYLATLFGSFGEKPVQVQWRFHPDAPEPEKWKFHPTQKVEIEPDGSVLVTFRAGGMDDMARHLVGWWDWVEVVKPKRLRERVLKMKLAGLAPLVAEFADRRTAARIRNLATKLGATQLS